MLRPWKADRKYLFCNEFCKQTKNANELTGVTHMQTLHANWQQINVSNEIWKKKKQKCDEPASYATNKKQKKKL